MLQLLQRSTRAARLSAVAPCSERLLPGGARLPRTKPLPWANPFKRAFGCSTIGRQQTAAAAAAPTPQDEQLSFGSAQPPHPSPRSEWRKLPIVCPGCGAHSQTVDADAAGFYGPKRRKRDAAQARHREDDEVFEQVLQSGAIESAPMIDVQTTVEQQVSICDRCHHLLHNGVGSSIIHPSMQSIQTIIEESPHKHNHIYHVVDAADFPMSLIPNLQSALQLPRLRTQNRRSKSIQYVRGRVAEVSFIITRSDLLAPQKEQVDRLMPYLQECLRDALGRSGKSVRLGNVRCVSAKRGWWTKTVKEEIWKRGGAGWMVGKVNVGKSALFETVFPKGRGHKVDGEEMQQSGRRRAIAANAAQLDAAPDAEPGQSSEIENDAFGPISPNVSDENVIEELQPYQETDVKLEQQQSEEEDDNVPLDENEEGSLLPPAQPETAYPHMPLVSSLPGTTASPIRVPFGNGKGELIDLPGIHRSSLEAHVKDEHRNDLIMKFRIKTEQHTLKPGQSLLLGGMIRITPKTPDLVFLAYPFVSTALSPHVTSNDKAVAIQTGIHPVTGEAYTGTVDSVATEPTKQKISSAGIFKLEWNVTKRRAGPVTAAAAGKQKADNLPFIVYSADLLIEGVGWVELVAQVRARTRRPDAFADALSEMNGEDAAPDVPEVEVFSPEGKFVGVRRPMNAWLLGGPKKAPAHERKTRPRQTVSYMRRKEGGRQGQSS